MIAYVFDMLVLSNNKAGEELFGSMCVYIYVWIYVIM